MVERGFLVFTFCSIAIAGGMPSISSTSGLDILPRNCLAYDERLSAKRLWPSANNVSKASDDFPEPEIPVITTNLPRGISTVISLRLFTLAFLTMMFPSSFICITCPSLQSSQQIYEIYTIHALELVWILTFIARLKVLRTYINNLTNRRKRYVTSKTIQRPVRNQRFLQ